MTNETLSTPSIDTLRSRFRGEIVLPDNPDFDERRSLFNAVYDKHPAVIAECDGTGDVVAAIRYARAAGLEIAVRSGGRHMSGFASADGGLVVDLARMRGVKVDRENETAWVQCGANGGDVLAETTTYGLGAVVGATTLTGVGGVNLHGGIGWLSKKLGWGCDTILELELVTADGEVLHVTPEEHPDLFWAVRGAGSNFGVVTWMKLKLAPLPEKILAGALLYDGDQAAEIMRFLRDFNLNATGEFSIMLDFLAGPPEEWLPKELHGKLLLSVTLVHIGDEPSQAEDDLRPFLDEFPPAVGELTARDLLDFMLEIDADYQPVRQWYDEEQVEDLTEEVIEIAVNRAALLAEKGLGGYLIVYPFKQASVEPEVPSCFPTRPENGWSVGTAGFWEEETGDAPHREWSDASIAAFRDAGLTTGIVYDNVQQLPDEQRQRESHGEEDWQRLREIKAKYDPENVFHLNHNIPPAN